MFIGKKEFTNHRTYIVGILNVTPDSFSDGGCHNTFDKAYDHAMRMMEEGADMIDIGGQSTRPGYSEISESEEIERICPVLEKLSHQTEIPLSIDTYKTSVASAAIKAGANLINDIWGLRADSGMGQLISENHISCCLMHNRRNSSYQSFLTDYLSDLRLMIDNALDAKIEPSKIIIDPGIGFAKDYEQNLIVLGHLEQLKEFGYPILVGGSRKSVIGQTLNLPVDERLEGTLALTAYCSMHDIMFVRVHDVKENVRVVRMLEAIYNKEGSCLETL